MDFAVALFGGGTSGSASSGNGSGGNTNASGGTVGGSIDQSATESGSLGTPPPPLTPLLLKALQDKVYEKRKSAALELERALKDWLSTTNSHHPINTSHVPDLSTTFHPSSAENTTSSNPITQRIASVLDHLILHLIYAPGATPNARNGGLIALAAVAIAVGDERIQDCLGIIVPAILSCFLDHDSRVRYYACEALYNVAKMSRARILVYFNEMFDVLCRLASDPEPSVKNGAELLNRLIKDIVTVHSTYVRPGTSGFVSTLSPSPPGHDLKTSTSVYNRSMAIGSNALVHLAHVPGSSDVAANAAPILNLTRFIPLLAERIRTKSPQSRVFLVQWIGVLNAVPDLEMVIFLPEFLDGLLEYVQDPHPDVRIATLNVVGEFLKEIKEIIQTSCVDPLSFESPMPPEGGPNTGPYRDEKPLPTPGLTDHSLRGIHSRPFLTPTPSGLIRLSADPKVVISNIEKMVKILESGIKSGHQETQEICLHWINEFIILFGTEMLPYTANLINAVLPCVSSKAGMIKNLGVQTNNNLFMLVQKQADLRRSRSTLSVSSENALHLPSWSSILPPKEGLEFPSIVDALTHQFLEAEEESQIAALDWFLMLNKCFFPEAPDMPSPIIHAQTFQALLRALADISLSEEVLVRDLQLIAQICENREMWVNETTVSSPYFSQVIMNLIDLFKSDGRLLEARGSLMIRQLCQRLDPERIFRTFAEIVEHESSLVFASNMVQHLNLILLTTPELSTVRSQLKSLDQPPGSTLFPVLYRSWCHNSISALSLCLLSMAYEHAGRVLMSFAELEISVGSLIQLDKLVQLLESPVFTFLRLQLLEPEKYPHLLKCMFGILMVLPQSSAFVSLKNRLNAISPMAAFLYQTPISETRLPRTMGNDVHTMSSTEDSDIKWSELLNHFRSIQNRHFKVSSSPNIVSNSVSACSIDEEDSRRIPPSKSSSHNVLGSADAIASDLKYLPSTTPSSPAKGNAGFFRMPSSSSSLPGPPKERSTSVSSSAFSGFLGYGSNSQPSRSGAAFKRHASKK